MEDQKEMSGDETWEFTDRLQCTIEAARKELPEGREKYLVLTKLEEALLWYRQLRDK